MKLKPLHDGSIQVEKDTGQWLVFSLDELRSHSAVLPADRVEGAPRLSAAAADLFVWSAFAAARGYAREHGLITDG